MSVFVVCGCADLSSYPRHVEGPPGLTLPHSARDFKIRAGMTVADVKRILQLSDPIDTAFDLRLPVVGGPKRTVIGCHNLMWLDDYVNKVYFYKGKDLDHIEGIWLLSEYEREDNKCMHLTRIGVPILEGDSGR